MLTEDFGRALGPVNGGVHGALMCISLFCAYGAIRFEGGLSVCLGWVGINLTVFLAFYIDQLGQVNYSSRKALKVIRRRVATLRSMDKQVQRKWLQRKVLCLRDLRIQIGSAFYYDKVLLLTTFQILLQNITNLLLLQ